MPVGVPGSPPTAPGAASVGRTPTPHATSNTPRARAAARRTEANGPHDTERRWAAGRPPNLASVTLDAATVLLQWATGGLFFTWFTTRRREVGLGYGWLLRGIYLLLAAVAPGLRAWPSAWSRYAR